ncbi:hypothetical protein EJ08DRAFT_656734 [Tothia fuscella]|uniref:Uncharacterized protein n=1 Tax=Tothia fuscella TaxID=1048955 RepID=A0A9P4U3M5_9PEZI|nr:hypothetical protein EJ08DRAFT_656734 [Tothia fuscella]
MASAMQDTCLAAFFDEVTTQHAIGHSQNKERHTLFTLIQHHGHMARATVNDLILILILYGVVGKRDSTVVTMTTTSPTLISHLSTQKFVLVQEHLIPNNLKFAFVTLDSWGLRVQLPRETETRPSSFPHTFSTLSPVLSSAAPGVSPAWTRSLVMTLWCSSVLIVLLLTAVFRSLAVKEPAMRGPFPGQHQQQYAASPHYPQPPQPHHKTPIIDYTPPTMMQTGSLQGMPPSGPPMAPEGSSMETSK